MSEWMNCTVPSSLDEQMPVTVSLAGIRAWRRSKLSRMMHACNLKRSLLSLPALSLHESSCLNVWRVQQESLIRKPSCFRVRWSDKKWSSFSSRRHNERPQFVVPIFSRRLKSSCKYFAPFPHFPFRHLQYGKSWHKLGEFAMHTQCASMTGRDESKMGRGEQLSFIVFKYT